MAIGQALETKSLTSPSSRAAIVPPMKKKARWSKSTQTAEEVGDEPWLLKKYFPDQDVFIGRDRLRSIATAAARNNRIRHPG